MRLRYLRHLVWLCALLLGSTALARVTFELRTLSTSALRGFDELRQSCEASAAGSFWCAHLNDELTLITTKGNDYLFDEAGELLAVFTKPQKGQNNLSNDGSYRLGFDNNQNLISAGAQVPGGALLVNGEYLAPEAVQGSWERLERPDGPVYQGTFSYRVGEVEVEKTIVVSNITHLLEVSLAARTTAEGERTLAYTFSGIARTEEPVIKIGQGSSFVLNPAAQPVGNPSYISLQNNNRNTGNALILRPAGDAAEVEALATPPGGIALQTTLNQEARLELSVYAGPNELVRYQQEGLLELAGLFKPNLLGQLSLGVLWILRQIRNVVPDWGLSIIVLTLLFRALIWPLITTQTKSMYGMQQLQPKIQALQKKYKDDREKLTQETMKLYREAGVNPAGGCLPILLQMPLFIILWRIFANVEFNSGFLWIPDLGQPDPFYILPILYVLVILAQSYFMAQGNPQQMRQQMIMNVVFVFLFLNFPAGVILYYVVSMLVQVVQYWLIKRGQPAAPVRAT